MKSLEDFLIAHAARQADRPAVIAPDGMLTYAQLCREAAAHAARYRDHKGGAVVFRASQTAAFVAEYLGIHLAGAVAVPLESTATDRQADAIATTLDGRRFAEGTADILYTTGTTGRPKGVVVSQRAILADAENLTEAQGFAADLTFIVSGPLNHIGSLSKLWPVVMTGGTLHILDGMKDFGAFFAAVDRAPHRVATFLVPATLRILAAFGAEKLSQYVNKIDFIETGAAPLYQKDMETLCRLLPKSRLYNTYASTETGIIATHNYNQEGGCKEGCLGRAMKNSSFRITEDGRIACAGPTLMDGYIADDGTMTERTTASEFLTADLGRTDDEGRLWLTGRMDDFINTGGYKVSPSEVEEAALAYPDIADCVCVAEPHPIMGESLKLIVSMKDGKRLFNRELAIFLKSRLESYKVPLKYEQADHIERTYNGKLNRKFYQ